MRNYCSKFSISWGCSCHENRGGIWPTSKKLNFRLYYAGAIKLVNRWRGITATAFATLSVLKGWLGGLVVPYSSGSSNKANQFWCVEFSEDCSASPTDIWDKSLPWQSLSYNAYICNNLIFNFRIKLARQVKPFYFHLVTNCTEKSCSTIPSHRSVERWHRNCSFLAERRALARAHAKAYPKSLRILQL